MWQTPLSIVSSNLTPLASRSARAGGDVVDLERDRHGGGLERDPERRAVEERERDRAGLELGADRLLAGPLLHARRLEPEHVCVELARRRQVVAGHDTKSTPVTMVMLSP